MASDAEIQALREILNKQFDELHKWLQRITMALEALARKT